MHALPAAAAPARATGLAVHQRQRPAQQQAVIATPTDA